MAKEEFGIKYKVNELAKDLNMAPKQILDQLAALGGEAKKVSSNLTEGELNYLLEHYTQANQEPDLQAYLNSANKPETKKEEPRRQEAKGGEQHNKKQKAKQQNGPKQPKRQTVSLAEAAKAVGAVPASGKKNPAPVESVEVKRETVMVDTRTVDVNLDKFNEKYSDLASTKNVENRRKPTPAGNKQKFNNQRKNRQQPFQRKRESEAERLQRIQLEKARKAQLKVSIPDEITVGELATRLKKTAAEVIKKFMQMGEMHAISDVVDFDSAALVAEEFHAKVEREVHVSIEERLFETEEDAAEDLVSPSPRGGGHGPRGPRQDQHPGRHPQDQRDRGRGRRHHPGTSALTRSRSTTAAHHLPGYPGP